MVGTLGIDVDVEKARLGSLLGFNFRIEVTALVHRSIFVIFATPYDARALDPVFASAFGAVKRIVGCLKEKVWIVNVLWKCRDTDTESRKHFSAVGNRNRSHRSGIPGRI